MQTSRFQRRHVVLWLVVLATTRIQSAEAADPVPTPTPTPAPTARSLAELSGQRELGPAHAKDSAGVVVSDHNLSRLADRGRLAADGSRVARTHTPAAQEQDLLRALEESARREQEERRLWRDRYRAQLDLVAELEAELELLEVEVGSLWIEFLRTKNEERRNLGVRPKLEAAKRKREIVTARLERERARLPKILEEARRAGAQPGWFRGLDTR